MQRQDAAMDISPDVEVALMSHDIVLPQGSGELIVAPNTGTAKVVSPWGFGEQGQPGVQPIASIQRGLLGQVVIPGLSTSVWSMPSSPTPFHTPLG